MLPIVTPAEMRAIDAAAPEPVDVLVGRAGWAVAKAALRMLGGSYGRSVHVIAGRGNNGADGRTAGELLARRGVRVNVVEAADVPAVLPPADLVLDAAYGTGFRGEWSAPAVGSTPVLAVDIPSGVDALTGQAGPGVLAAEATVTFQALKPGLLLPPGSVLAGSVEVADIGLDVSSATRHLVEPDDVTQWWPRRAVDAHKWGNAVAVVAGSPGMYGAAELCATAAMRAGAGLVRLASLGGGRSVADEVVRMHIDDEGTVVGGWADQVLAGLDRFSALAIGPGIGRSDATVAATRQMVAEAPVPVVVDGDGLFALGGSVSETARLLASRTAPTVLTPHDGEFRRLAGGRRPGADRMAAVADLAAALGCTVLAKGPATLVADQTGSLLAIDIGDERLATAGSGDVLTGIISAALAGGCPPLRAAAGGAWVHAAAGRAGPGAGLVAGDLVTRLPTVLAAW